MNQMLLRRRVASSFDGIPYPIANYLIFSGGQYIDTGFKANTTTTRFECEFSPATNVETRGIFGSRNHPRNEDYSSCNIFIIDDYIRADWFNGDNRTQLHVENNAVCELVITRGYMVFNGTTYTNSNTYSVNQNYNFLIGSFMSGNGTPYRNGFIGKWHYAKLFSNDVLIFDGVPVIADGAGCFYDKVSGELFRNVGTGTIGYA